MITVIGSLNMDLVVSVKEVPKQGETTLGERFSTIPGGKGANQAVAAARLGATAQMIGCVGNDSYGIMLIENLKKEQIDVTNVQRLTNTQTGIANILVSNRDNRIIVIPGANYFLTPDKINGLEAEIRESKLVVVQLEIPEETVLKILQLCQTFSIPTLLNPAPANHFNIEFMNYATYITPNETECSEIFGVNYEDALEKYPNQLIVTLGKNGVQYFDGEKHVRINAFKTNVVDTTGAGDTFNGAFAFGISQNYTLKDAIEFANAAASLSVEKFGAQGGMPTFKAVEEKLMQIE